jgi:hypothetical protein
MSSTQLPLVFRVVVVPPVVVVVVVVVGVAVVLVLEVVVVVVVARVVVVASVVVVVGVVRVALQGPRSATASQVEGGVSPDTDTPSLPTHWWNVVLQAPARPLQSVSVVHARQRVWSAASHQPCSPVGCTDLTRQIC